MRDPARQVGDDDLLVLRVGAVAERHRHRSGAGTPNPAMLLSGPRHAGAGSGIGYPRWASVSPARVGSTIGRPDHRPHADRFP